MPTNLPVNCAKNILMFNLTPEKLVIQLTQIFIVIHRKYNPNHAKNCGGVKYCVHQLTHWRESSIKKVDVASCHLYLLQMILNYYLSHCFLEEQRLHFIKKYSMW